MEKRFFDPRIGEAEAVVPQDNTEEQTKQLVHAPSVASETKTGPHSTPEGKITYFDKNPDSMVLDKAVWKTITENGKWKFLGKDPIAFDPLPEELKDESFPEASSEEIRNIPYHSMADTVEIVPLAKELHRGNDLTLGDAVFTMKRLFNEVPPEEWNEGGFIADVLFRHKDKLWAVVAIRYNNDNQDFIENHINIGYYRVLPENMTAGDREGGKYIIYLPEGCIVSL